MPKCKGCSRKYPSGCVLEGMFEEDVSLNCPPCDVDLYYDPREKEYMSRQYVEAGAGQLEACIKCPMKTQCITLLVAA